MVDIRLELPDEVIAAYKREAKFLGTTAEALMRKVIEDLALPPQASQPDFDMSIYDAPIVKAAEIEKEYRRLGYKCGWRFATCPFRFKDSSKLLLVGLNPGGRVLHGPAWSQEEGSAYCVESWNGRPIGVSPLQRQVQAMFQLLGLRDEEVFSAYFVPFRSPTWKELGHKNEAKHFAEGLWKWLLPQVSFERVVCMGKDAAAKAMVRLLNASFETTLPVGWGDQTADRYRLPDGRDLIALPHPSRFSIFDRPQGALQLQNLFFA